MRVLSRLILTFPMKYFKHRFHQKRAGGLLHEEEVLWDETGLGCPIAFEVLLYNIYDKNHISANHQFKTKSNRHLKCETYTWMMSVAGQLKRQFYPFTCIDFSMCFFSVIHTIHIRTPRGMGQFHPTPSHYFGIKKSARMDVWKWKYKDFTEKSENRDVVEIGQSTRVYSFLAYI
jgi:hypothetical protein